MPFKCIEKRKAYQKAYHKRHYKENKGYYTQKAIARNKKQRVKNKEFLSRYKSFVSCVDCGESNPIVLEFDHVRGEKITNIADMVHSSYSIEAIKKEIRKCEVCCANCHRIRTHKRRN